MIEADVFRLKDRCRRSADAFHNCTPFSNRIPARPAPSQRDFFKENDFRFQPVAAAMVAPSSFVVTVQYSK